MTMILPAIRRSPTAVVLLLVLLLGLASSVLAQGTWRLLVVSDLSEVEARSNAEDNLQGFENVEIIKDPQTDKYSVVMGFYPTREAAEAAKNQLQTESGVMTVGPIQMQGGALPGANDGLDALKRQAEAAEASGDRAGALRLWTDIRGKAPAGALFDEAGRKIAQLQQASSSGAATPPPASSSGGNNMMLILIIVGAVVVVGVVVAVVVMKKKSAPAPAPVVAAPAPVLPKPTVPAPRSSVPKPAAPAAAAVAAASSKPASSSAAPASIPLVAPISLEESKAGQPQRQRRTSLAEVSAGEVKLDFLDDSPSGSGSRPSEQSSRALQFSPLADDILLGGESRSGQALLFSQDFAKDPVGKQPANWSGDYEYASLLVEENEGKRALRFEKQSGTGSAYYCCRFPDAQGRIAAEFDIRCDDKNKYLLGFYIEKDQDFRQSIHAIVHRANPNSPPVLKLQNESIEYEFGTWRSIRLEIDLTRQILDAFVDGKQVLVGTRLTQCPNVVNTLSFRDNLATTGILLVRNIRLFSLAA